MIKTVKVSDKGQIAIPQNFRESLGIDKGDDLTLVQIEGKILIEKSQITEEKIKEDFNDILKFSEDSLKEVWDNPEDEIWNEYLK
tara:strand:- start:15 stop:269 length:255 start_codon:yes stop_codon:yes gene_type:complete